MTEPNPTPTPEPKPTPTPPPTPAPTPTPEPTPAPTPDPAPKAPDTYTLKLPDGSLLDAAHLERTAAFAKERGLSNEDAQKVLERDHATVVAFIEGQKQAMVKKSEEWVQFSKADKEIGGEAFAKNAELAKRVLEKYGTESLRKTLDETGYGNHPELLRVFARVGKAMAEDTLVQPGASGAGTKSPESIMYPKMGEKTA